uniref:(northern house mosquito) hypothetical protein n=1 Tax=Culex pipiens TaxID=7175 RepID=A0A8D8NIG1_CULPI
MARGNEKDRTSQVLRRVLRERVQAAVVVGGCAVRERVRNVDQRAKVHGGRYDQCAVLASGRAMAAQRILRHGESVRNGHPEGGEIVSAEGKLQSVDGEAQRNFPRGGLPAA